MACCGKKSTTRPAGGKKGGMRPGAKANVMTMSKKISPVKNSQTVATSHAMPGKMMKGMMKGAMGMPARKH